MMTQTHDQWSAETLSAGLPGNADASTGLPLNRSMDREELFTDSARPYVDGLNELVHSLYARELAVSGWIGKLPKPGEASKPQGMEQRLDYQPLPDAADDLRFPWFLYWETYAALAPTLPKLKPGSRILDAGGSSSLFSFYLASQGHRVDAVDLSVPLTDNARHVAKQMGWDMHSHVMNMADLDFEDGIFDQAYSICVFEHLDYDLKRMALHEIARTLKPGGLLTITFDYRNPAPGVLGVGKDPSPRNQLTTQEDLERQFLSTPYFEMEGNRAFSDNGKRYLMHHRFDDGQGSGMYSFGSMNLRKVAEPETRAVVAMPDLAANFGLGDDPEQTTLQTPARPLSHGLLDTKVPALKEPDESFTLSVVVCTYRRPWILKYCLRSLASQSLSPDLFEVIVVDNNSKDRTAEVVERFAKESDVTFRYFREKKQGLSHSRNRGLQESQADYVIYLDDDARATPQYLDTVHRTLMQHRPDIMGGPIYPFYTDAKPSWFEDDWEVRQHNNVTGWTDRMRISGSNFVIRRKLLKQLGNFDPSLGMVGDKVRLGEERAVMEAYGQRYKGKTRVYYDLGAVVLHHVPKSKMNLRYHLKRFYAAGLAKAAIERNTVKRRFSLRRRGKYLWTAVKVRARQIRTAGIEFLSATAFELGRVIGCLPGVLRRRFTSDD